MKWEGAQFKDQMAGILFQLLSKTSTTLVALLFLVSSSFSTQSAFPEAPACSPLGNDGQRALCQVLAALESSAPHLTIFNSSHGWRLRYIDEGGSYLHRYAAEPSLELDLVLQSYAKMHAACTFSERENLVINSTTLQCKYLVWSCTFGLGNQLMSLVSAFLLSILSQRVLLIDNASWNYLFSEPFAESTWLAPPGFTFKDVATPTTAEFRSSRCASNPSSVNTRCHTNVVSVVFALDTSTEDQQLLVCPSAILALRKITFLNLRNSNQHFAVGFFFNPALRPLLELLFPERNVFHALSRFLLIPSDAVWDKIRLHYRELLKVNLRIGVQLRESKGDYRHYFDDAVPSCVKSKSRSCPIEIENASIEGDGSSSSSSEELVSIYVSSLVGGHFAKLNESMHRLEGETRQRYVLLSQPSDGEQIDDVAHQQKALVDIWMLSLSDILFTTHISTFGYTAHALAGITPYHLKHWADKPCELSLSSDPCYHFAPKRVTCPGDDFSLEDPLVEVSYVRECPDIPGTGLQLEEIVNK